MKGSCRKREKEELVRVELKYCEHCGGLWLRECGAGTVYCPSCAAKVADLPAAKKRSRGATLPVRPPAVIESYGDESGDVDLEAAGGAA